MAVCWQPVDFYIPMGYDMNGMGVIINSEGTCSSGGSGSDGHVDLNGSCSCWNNWEEPPAQWLKGEGCPADSIAPGGAHTLMPCKDGSKCLKPNITVSRKPAGCRLMMAASGL